MKGGRVLLYVPSTVQVNYEIMRQFFLLRASLVPYIYSSVRQTYDEGLSLLRPLYYLFPEAPQAYDFDMQYMFGNDLLVAPITEPVDPITLMTTKQIWIPEVGGHRYTGSIGYMTSDLQGSYISWFSGEYITGPVTITRTFTLAEMPVYAKEGSIIAVRTDDFCKTVDCFCGCFLNYPCLPPAPLGSAQEIPNKMKFVVFVGKANRQARYFMPATIIKSLLFLLPVVVSHGCMKMTAIQRTT